MTLSKTFQLTCNHGERERHCHLTVETAAICAFVTEQPRWSHPEVVVRVHRQHFDQHLNREDQREDLNEVAVIKGQRSGQRNPQAELNQPLKTYAVSEIA